MKVLPSKADPCIWLRKAPNLRCYEFIPVYVKVKGDGKLNYHLIWKTQMELLLADLENTLIN